MKEVFVKYLKNLQQEAIMGEQRLIIDEPQEFGGDGKGPNPYDLLLAALGGCTAMTIIMYAKRKEIPLEGVQVRLTHEKIYAQDCSECMTKEG